MSIPQKEDSIKYRPDIDGLRALAVVAVLLFHYFPLSFKNGFLGVDIFFLISGFLVTSIIANNIKQNTFSFGMFYLKRIRRLFPSLIIVLFVTTILGLVFFLSNELILYGKHLFSGAFFSTNFFLFKESGYFDKSSDLKPLLHLWSLCIEEQFYLVWPLLIFALHRKNSRHLFPGVLVVSLISYCINWHFSSKYPMFNFYLLPSRLWELGFGGVLAILSNRSFQFQYKERYVALLTKYIFPITGLLLIMIVLFFLNESKVSTFSLTNLSILGTTLIILADKESPVNKFFSYKVIVYVGLISYPLYLWHWPLLSVTKIVEAGDVSRGFRIVLLIVSFLLAIATYEWIEKPIKKIRSNKIIYKILALFLLVSFSGLMIWISGGFPHRYEQIEKFRLTSKAYTGGREEKPHRICTKNFLEIEMCSISKIDEKPSVLLLGDSHANHLYPGIKEFYDRRGENVLLFAKSGTPPFINVNTKPTANFNDVLEFLEKNDSIHTVIISAFWGSYFMQDGVYIPGTVENYKNPMTDVEDPTGKSQKDIFSRALDRLLSKLSEKRNVIVFQDIPSLPFVLESCLPRPHIGKRNQCHFKLSDSLESQKELRALIEAQVTKYPTVKIVDPVFDLCANGECAIEKNGIILYSDEHHLSAEGAKLLMSAVLK